MWIIQFQKIKPRDYNFISRLLKKSWFISRRIPDIVLVKSTIIHILQKKSWRFIANNFWVSHIWLFNFYNFIKEKEELKIIFHEFIDRRILLYLAKNKQYSNENLDNNEEIIKLTKIELESIITIH